MTPRTVTPLLLALAFAGLVPSPPVPPPETARADELGGLWTAKRRFGPDVRGPLVIERSGDRYTADMMGRLLPVRVDGDELSFAWLGEQGAFRGALRGNEIRGVWIPPRSIAMGGHATPVVLTADGPDRWSGVVEPFDDVFTFHLLVRERPDGSLSALLRNPERDFGALLGVRHLVREGDVVELHGKAPWMPEEGVVAAGSYTAETDVITLAFPGRGGSYDFRRAGDESGFYPRGRNTGRYGYRPPPVRDDGWPTGTLEDVDLDRAAVERFVQGILDMPMDTLPAPQTHGLLIARNGTLVLEEYFHGEHRDRLHETRSAAKSVAATLVGAALEAGAPLELSSPVYRVMNGGAFPADLEPRKRSMTLEHLLTMSSGYFCDDNNPDAPGREDTVQEQAEEPDWLRYTLAVPMAFATGDTAIYCSANPNLALGVLGRAMEETPLSAFDRLLAVPLGIERYGWPLDPAGNPYGGGGVQFLPRDFLKFGQLMLDGGTWQGRRILAADFVERASSPLVRVRDRGYGYLWWVDDLPRGDGSVSTFSAMGAGGQVLTVIPELDLVILHLGGSYSSAGWRYAQAVLIPDAILPAVR